MVGQQGHPIVLDVLVERPRDAVQDVLAGMPHLAAFEPNEIGRIDATFFGQAAQALSCRDLSFINKLAELCV